MSQMCPCMRSEGIWSRETCQHCRVHTVQIVRLILWNRVMKVNWKGVSLLQQGKYSKVIVGWRCHPSPVTARICYLFEWGELRKEGRSSWESRVVHPTRWNEISSTALPQFEKLGSSTVRNFFARLTFTRSKEWRNNFPLRRLVSVGMFQTAKPEDQNFRRIKSARKYLSFMYNNAMRVFEHF